MCIIVDDIFVGNISAVFGVIREISHYGCSHLDNRKIELFWSPNRFFQTESIL